jgi:1-deoxy-D-xylulose-5-phosphate reductoisomerase
VRQRIAVLGSTGSIGCNTLDVVARHAERFEVFALTAARRTDLLAEQCLRHAPRFAAVMTGEAARELQARLRAAGSRTSVPRRWSRSPLRPRSTA